MRLPIIMIVLYSKQDEVAKFLPDVIAQADLDKNSLGFLPERVYREATEQGKLIVAINQEHGNESYAGHLLFGGVFPFCRIYQANVKADCRGRNIGRLLIDELVRNAEAIGYISVTAKVANDLPANAFWQKMRFEHVRTARGGASRNRQINVRVRELNTPHLFRPSETSDNLHLVERLSNRAPLYAVDLNVMFDIVRRRSNAEDAGRIMAAAFNNLIRLAVTGEFIQELKRNSRPPDPVLEFALKLPILPQPVEKDVKQLIDSLAIKIFPGRARGGKLNVQDRSDLIHLATAISQKVAGFITSEKAILSGREYLREAHNLDVIGVAELAEAIGSEFENEAIQLTTNVDNLQLIRRPAESGDAGKIDDLLSRLGVARQLVDELSTSIACNDSEQLVVIDNGVPIAFLTWTTEFTGQVKAFLCADEERNAIELAIDHLLDTVCRSCCSRKPALITLRLVAGHTRTRSIAITHGFRPNEDQPAIASTLRKMPIGACITSENWDYIHSQVKRISGVLLPEKIPSFDHTNVAIEVQNAIGKIARLSLFDLEMLLSPVLFLLPGRAGAIVPIRARFAADLFGDSLQLRLTESSEASFLREKVYFSDPRTSDLLRKGKPILFYESGKAKGRASVIAAARVLRTDLISKDAVTSELFRRGVLDERALTKMGRSPFLAATSFDNLMFLKKPVSFDKMRDLGFEDRSNLITTRHISDSLFQAIVREGNPSA